MALTTTLPQQAPSTPDRRAADRRQTDQPVAVERRGSQRRTEGTTAPDPAGRLDATSFSQEALSGTRLYTSQVGQLAARQQLNSTLHDLLGGSPNAQTCSVTGPQALGARATPNARRSEAAGASSDQSQRQLNYARRNREIQRNVNISDDTLRNLKITQDYSQLSKEMRDMIGADGGANWCSFATWASRQAGETIRQEDLGTAAKVGKQAVDKLGPLGYLLPGGPVAKAGSAAYDASSAQVAAGNRKVYQEIAPQFARFIETFKGDQQPDPEKLTAFQQGFAKDGSQDGLKQAFDNYHKAMFEKDPDKKKELMFLANGQIGEHEQRRLQPQIQAALPYGSREFATSNMMRLGLPDGRGGVKPISLGRDVPAFRGQSAPLELQGLQNPDAQRLVDRYDRNPDRLTNSGAQDWTNLDQRMNFIVDLFRSRHDDPALFQDPFSPSQTREIAANRVPNLATP
jgi:hypothetical protein